MKLLVNALKMHPIQRKLRVRLQTSDWLLVGISLAILSLYLFYTIDFVYFTPYPGIEVTGSDVGWLVNDSIHPDVNDLDVISKIGDLSYQEYLDNRWLTPFEELKEESSTTLVLDSGESVTIEKIAPTLQDIFRRMLSSALFFPFWLFGTSVLLLLRPRDIVWLLLVAFMYLIAIWVITGALSVWRVAGSRIMLGVAEWLLVPVLLHLHLSVPKPLWPRLDKYLWIGYVLAFGLAIAEVFQRTPYDAPLLALALAIVLSILLLIYRAISPHTPREKITTRLLLTGLLFAFGPGLIYVLFPSLQASPQTNTLVLTVAFLAIPSLPFLYVYALFKHRLGNLEFRANRLLATYGFIIIYPPLLLLCVLLGNRLIASAGLRTVFLLFVSMVFVYFSPWFLDKFHRAINRLAYDTQHNPEEIVAVIANRLPSILRKDLLISLLRKEVFGTLLIREAALFVLDGGEYLPWVQVGNPTLPDSYQLVKLLPHKGTYLRPDEPFLSEPVKWVRLMLPLNAGNKLVGFLLLGRRDPDDFYPTQDINLLKTIANQMATVIENIHLYEELEKHADKLADEVNARTVDLQTERDRTQAILDSAGEGILYMDREGMIQYCNEAVQQITGYTRDEVYGKPLHSWRTDIAITKLPEPAMSFAEGKGWNGELRLRRKDFSEIDIQVTITPLNSEIGELLGFVGVVSDVSKIREAERMKSNFVANVSHELKTPLTNINLYLGLLRRAREDKRADYLSVLESESNRLAQLIQDLLDLSKIESSTGTEQIELINVLNILAATVDVNKKLAERKKIELMIPSSEQRLFVQANGKQLEQVFTNLLANAINYTPEGGQVFIMWGISHDVEEYPIWISISDTGYGIAPDELPFIFDRFYRGTNGPENNIPGTGLGLAICKAIVEQHKGTIEVQSELQIGSNFTVRLPFSLGKGDLQTLV